MIEHVDPREIEPRSLRIIEAEVPEPRPYQGGQWLVVRRMIHATADFELLDLVRFHPEAIRAGVEALAAGGDIVTDTEMARAGIPLRRVGRLGCAVHCLLADPEAAEAANSGGVTRTAAAVDVAVRRGLGDIFVIGNAPTALVRLLEHVRAGAVAPRLVVGMPVGFVNAAESKELLMRCETLPFVTVQGRKGGSPLAAAAVNALAEIALGEAGQAE